MFHQKTTSLKSEIACVLAIAAAGFKLSENKSIVTDDGAAWRATLTHGRTKIVTVSNGGYGGPDESHFHATTPADKASLATLFALPEVVTTLRYHMMSTLDLEHQHNKHSELAYIAAQNEIQTQLPSPTEENVEFLVGRVADLASTVNSFKRAIKTKLLVVFEGCDTKREYVTYKLADTTANRERVRVQEKHRRIDYFIADLFSAPNESKGA